MAEALRVARRFHGPPDSGNGGYVAGRLAAFLDGPVAVRLRRPPPLETDLEVAPEADGVRLVHEGVVVAEARPAEVDVAPPPAPERSAAAAASRRFRAFEEHPFETCFVCGPRRAEGDGLRIFPGPLAEGGPVACPWTPDASLGDAEGLVRPEFVWAALDCPGAFAFPQPEQAVVLLGELAVALSRPPRVGEPCTLVGFEIAHEGRKHVTGSALFDATGRSLGVGRGVWIEVARPPAPDGR